MTEIVLFVCTVLGGAAAVWFFWEKLSDFAKSGGATKTELMNVSVTMYGAMYVPLESMDFATPMFDIHNQSGEDLLGLTLLAERVDGKRVSLHTDAMGKVISPISLRSGGQVTVSARGSDYFVFFSESPLKSIIVRDQCGREAQNIESNKETTAWISSFNRRVARYQRERTSGSK